MKGKNHRKVNLFLALLFSIVYLYYTKNIAFEPLLKFWAGALLGIFFFSPDDKGPCENPNSVYFQTQVSINGRCWRGEEK